MARRAVVTPGVAGTVIGAGGGGGGEVHAASSRVRIARLRATLRGMGYDNSPATDWQKVLEKPERLAIPALAAALVEATASAIEGVTEPDAEIRLELAREIARLLPARVKRRLEG